MKPRRTCICRFRTRGRSLAPRPCGGRVSGPRRNICSSRATEGYIGRLSLREQRRGWNLLALGLDYCQLRNSSIYLLGMVDAAERPAEERAATAARTTPILYFIVEGIERAIESRLGLCY